MLDKPISPLRQRMIDDMTARRFKEKVQKDYVRHVRTFAAFLGRSPDTATSEDLRRFQVHIAKQQIGVPTINAAIAALEGGGWGVGARRRSLRADFECRLELARYGRARPARCERRWKRQIYQPRPLGVGLAA